MNTMPCAVTADLNRYYAEQAKAELRQERIDEQLEEYLGRQLGELLMDYGTHPTVVKAIYDVLHKREKKTPEEQALYDALEELARAAAEHVTE